MDYYFKEPERVIFVPRGAHLAVYHAAQAVYAARDILIGLGYTSINFLDDNLNAVGFYHHGILQPFGPGHLFDAMEEDAKAMLLHGLYAWSVSCRTSWLSSDSVGIICQWGRYRSAVLATSTWANLLFGGLFGLRVNTPLSLGKCFEVVNDDVERSVYHIPKFGAVVFFSKTSG